MAVPALPLLTTKLHAPRRRGLVARPRLSGRLDPRDPPTLTLVSNLWLFGLAGLTMWLIEMAWIRATYRCSSNGP